MNNSNKNIIEHYYTESFEGHPVIENDKRYNIFKNKCPCPKKKKFIYKADIKKNHEVPTDKPKCCPRVKQKIFSKAKVTIPTKVPKTETTCQEYDETCYYRDNNKIYCVYKY